MVVVVVVVVVVMGYFWGRGAGRSAVEVQLGLRSGLTWTCDTAMVRAKAQVRTRGRPVFRARFSGQGSVQGQLVRVRVRFRAHR